MSIFPQQLWCLSLSEAKQHIPSLPHYENQNYLQKLHNHMQLESLSWYNCQQKPTPKLYIKHFCCQLIPTNFSRFTVCECILLFSRMLHATNQAWRTLIVCSIQNSESKRLAQPVNTCACTHTYRHLKFCLKNTIMKPNSSRAIF